MWLRVGVVVIAFFVGSFVLWRRLREEYDGKKILEFWILSTACVAIIGGGINWMLYKRAGVWIWGGVGGMILALWWWCKRQEWKSWEVIDEMGWSGGWVMAILAIGRGAWERGAVYLAGLVFLKLVSQNYRRWRWYASGKPGLVGLLGMAWASGTELAIVNSGNGYLYWGGLGLSQWVGLWVLIASGVVVYLRSGRKTSEDILDLWQKITLKKLNHRF